METVVRVVVIYVALVAGLRAIGKREFSQLSPLELVTLLIIPEMVTQALVREDRSLTNAIVGVMTLLVVVYLSSLLQYHVKPAERAINSEPTVLVRHGKFITEHMNIERIPPEEVFMSMHQSGLTKLEEVQWAILETDGKITIVPKQPTSTTNAAPHEKDLAA
jgi:uncharacterized membrane protein YcaP (DUF421 family)